MDFASRCISKLYYTRVQAAGGHLYHVTGRVLFIRGLNKYHGARVYARSMGKVSEKSLVRDSSRNEH